MSKKQVLAAGFLAVASMGVAAPAMAELSGNIGVASQYVFRGVVFGDPQVSGGVDYAGPAGFYAGTWISSAGGEQEVDLYGGWANDVVDVGYLYYYFPDDIGTADAGEIYGGLNFNAFSLYAYYAPAGFNGIPDDDYIYVSGDVALPLTDKIELSLHVGATEGLGDAVKDDDTLIDYGVTVSFGDLFISATAIDYDTFVTTGQVANEPTFTVGYGWSFDDL